MKRYLLLLSIGLLLGCTSENNKMKQSFDWQGHRGARGLVPENSVPGFLKALEFPVTTLELDLAVSQDAELVVSHEPWFSATFCIHPDGRPVEASEEDSLNIFQMTYASIARFDCGSRGHAGFPDQLPMSVAKPSLRQVVQSVEQYQLQKGKDPVQYNIEIKSKPEWDGVFTPGPEAFSSLVLEEIRSLNIADRVCIQSFDPRVLEEVNRMAPDQTIAYLVEYPASLEEHLNVLSFKPDIYSPAYALLTHAVVEQAHDKDIRVIPWTVNDKKTMQSLIAMGVDGIITDYPNLITEVEE